MQATTFLNRLGLDQDADERAIKRAYARELKLIDQEADAPGFQALRQAYEIALHWVKHKAAHPVAAEPAAVPEHQAPAAPRAATPAIPAAPPRDNSTNENPQQMARAVFDRFLDICREMAVQGNAGDVVLWRKHLQLCSNDERLLNITARANFEYLVACMLAEGWRPGHEGLFIAARQVFSWNTDRRRLMEFGQAGGLLNQAIEECEMFSHQNDADCAGQVDAVDRVRSESKPSTGELITHVPHLRNMAARFPAWTRVIASTERIAEWIGMERDIPRWRRLLRFRRSSDTGTGASSFNWWQIALVLLALRGVISAFNSTPPPPAGFYPPRIEGPAMPLSEKEAKEEEAYRRAAGPLYMPPGTRTLDPSIPRTQPSAVLARPAAPAGRKLTDAELKTISDRIDYHPPHVRPGSYKVEFSIELDEHGAIRKITKKTASGLPILDKRTEEAIRASAPFGADIMRNFTLGFTQRYWLRPISEPEAAPAEPEAVQ